MVVARTLAVWPLAYIIQRKRNIYLGIIAHCAINAIDVIVGVVALVSLG
jgi:hypothetical protein